MPKTPCRCGADDCSRCHPENYHFGVYITNDPDEFELADEGTLDTVIVGPNGFKMYLCSETAADYRDPETGAMKRWDDLVRDNVLDAYGDFIVQTR